MQQRQLMRWEIEYPTYMAQIRRDTWRADNIVARELVNVLGKLQQHAERLTDSTRSSQDGNLGRHAAGHGGQERTANGGGSEHCWFRVFAFFDQ
jgi:hypothetical protein